jgi:hypothetical protein
VELLVVAVNAVLVRADAFHGQNVAVQLLSERRSGA